MLLSNCLETDLFVRLFAFSNILETKRFLRFFGVKGNGRCCRSCCKSLRGTHFHAGMLSAKLFDHFWSVLLTLRAFNVNAELYCFHYVACVSSVICHTITEIAFVALHSLIALSTFNYDIY